MGGLACMAGGAQLHSRENLIAIGGAIDTSTLAEDTFTTFQTQLSGRRVLFDPNAIVWAEEPDSVTALWKQRVRWGRGNLQITGSFLGLWFRPERSSLLGDLAFGILWFSIAMMPAFVLLGSLGLVGLYHLWTPWAVQSFTWLWGITFASFLFQTLFAFVIDPAEARRSWFEGIAFPGVLSLGVMLLALLQPFQTIGGWARPGDWTWGDIACHVILGWTAITTVLAWAIYRLDRAGGPKWLRNIALVLIGYGPLLCAVSCAAIMAELKKADLTWDKTIKSGKVRMRAK
jgi:hypothetical protein